MRIAVAGGTGLIGVHVVTAAQEQGHDVAVLSRSNGIDLVSGSGAEAALAGCAAVVDVTNVTALGAKTSVAFFGAVTGTLLDAGRRAGVGHHVALSIVGIDRTPYGYYAGKREQERLVAAGPLPWTVLRATQFHEFPAQLLDRTPGPVAVVPRMRSAPVAAAEVARRLVEIAIADPLGTAPEMAGPEILDMPDLARRLLRHRGSRRRVLGVRLPGAGGRAMAGDGLLPQGDDVLRGTQTWEQWLTGQ